MSKDFQDGGRAKFHQESRGKKISISIPKKAQVNRPKLSKNTRIGKRKMHELAGTKMGDVLKPQ